MQAQEGASERTQLDCQDTNGATDHPMQQHSIHMVIGSDAFAQDKGKAPICATTDQEGVVYLLAASSTVTPWSRGLQPLSLIPTLLSLLSAYIIRTYAYLLLSCLVPNLFGRRRR